MNKKIFDYSLKSKNYDKCIEILRKELIDILVKKINYKDRFFKYSTTKDLYYKAIEVLSEQNIIIAHTLYNMDIMDETDEYILDELLELYRDIKK